MQLLSKCVLLPGPLTLSLFLPHAHPLPADVRSLWPLRELVRLLRAVPMLLETPLQYFYWPQYQADLCFVWIYISNRSPRWWVCCVKLPERKGKKGRGRKKKKRGKQGNTERSEYSVRKQGVPRTIRETVKQHERAGWFRKTYNDNVFIRMK